jgi:hypothetical protein
MTQPRWIIRNDNDQIFVARANTEEEAVALYKRGRDIRDKDHVADIERIPDLRKSPIWEAFTEEDAEQP